MARDRPVIHRHNPDGYRQASDSFDERLEITPGVSSAKHVAVIARRCLEDPFVAIDLEGHVAKTSTRDAVMTFVAVGLAEILDEQTHLLEQHLLDRQLD